MNPPSSAQLESPLLASPRLLESPASSPGKLHGWLADLSVGLRSAQVLRGRASRVPPKSDRWDPAERRGEKTSLNGNGSDLRRSPGSLQENLLACSRPNLWSRWFDRAEKPFERIWNDTIWPSIRSYDFTSTLEIGPGAGRNSNKLKDVSGTLYLVDLNEYALRRCKERFDGYSGPCDLRYHQNDGMTLPFLEDGSVTCVYSWDTVVHFHPDVVRSYVFEFARVLAPGGGGFIHHSNHGSFSPEEDIHRNPHMRSSVSATSFRRDCLDAGLEVVEQALLDWDNEPELDCVTLFRRPVEASRHAQNGHAPRAHGTNGQAPSARGSVNSNGFSGNDAHLVAESNERLERLHRDNDRLKTLLAETLLENVALREQLTAFAREACGSDV